MTPEALEALARLGFTPLDEAGESTYRTALHHLVTPDDIANQADDAARVRGAYASLAASRGLSVAEVYEAAARGDLASIATMPAILPGRRVART